jgi:predicted nucleotidyltransferase
MRKPIFIDYTKPQKLSVYVRCKAYIFGSVAKGTDHAESDLDVYVTDEKTERKLIFRNPLVIFKGKVYPLHVVGPALIDKETFLKTTPEAQRI